MSQGIDAVRSIIWCGWIAWKVGIWHLASVMTDAINGRMRHPTRGVCIQAPTPGMPRRKRMAMVVLVDEQTGKAITVGQTVQTFRGEPVTVRGWTAPRHAGGTGRVLLEEADGSQHEYFPSVVGARVRVVDSRSRLARGC